MKRVILTGVTLVSAIVLLPGCARSQTRKISVRTRRHGNPVDFGGGVPDSKPNMKADAL